ncbi:phosphatase PAP2 family protein [Rhodoplanes sp. Z2-YC6860]|uniref:phosphatase PAP2 family protein n=1 Tax=Rhodoplanes sp. Z2-YC6860 TaxID=674703 RepID=UPI0018DE6919|nr:phosphatase PAP2 family protein [Rhodoplanes sp. Z2-YC6860]
MFVVNWIALGAVAAAFGAALLLTGFSVAPRAAIIGGGFVAVYGGFSFFNAFAVKRRDPQVVFVLGNTAQIVLITLLMAPFTYVAAAANFPMADAKLLAIDQFLGLDWLGYVTFVNERPLLATWLDFGYMMIRWPLFIIPVALAASGKFRRLQVYTLAFLIALIVTTIISTMIPAIGVYQQLGVSVTDFQNLNPIAYLGQLRDLPLVRNGSLRALDLDLLSGIITFPSFHAASALLYGWALWGSPWFRPVAIIANLAMLAATPITGGHYFIDVVAGLAVAAVAIVIAKEISRHVAAARFEEPVAAPATS